MLSPIDIPIALRPSLQFPTNKSILPGPGDRLIPIDLAIIKTRPKADILSLPIALSRSSCPSILMIKTIQCLSFVIDVVEGKLNGGLFTRILD